MLGKNTNHYKWRTEGDGEKGNRVLESPGKEVSGTLEIMRSPQRFQWAVRNVIFFS